MTSSSQSIIIEDSPEKEFYTEELAIDALKIDLITNLNIQLVQYLFKTKIEVKDKNNQKTGKKLVRLESHSAYSLAKSIKFVKALCNPELDISVPIDAKLIEELEQKNGDYKNNLIREHTVFLSTQRKNNVDYLFIQGMASDVTRAKAVITKYQGNLVEDEEDDVIWLSDGDQDSEKDAKKSFTFKSPAKMDTKSPETQNKPNVADGNKGHVPTELMKTAILLGFSKVEIQKVYAEKAVTNRKIDELDFMNCLQQSRLNKCEAIEKETKEVKVRNSARIDCEVIDILEEDRMSLGPIVNDEPMSLTMGQCGNTLSPISGLKEYGQMFNAHHFNSATEKENKMKRISALIAAMPSEQKTNALEQVNKQKEARCALTKTNKEMPSTSVAAARPSTSAEKEKQTEATTKEVTIGPKKVPAGVSTIKLIDAPNMQKIRLPRNTVKIKPNVPIILNKEAINKDTSKGPSKEPTTVQSKTMNVQPKSKEPNNAPSKEPVKATAPEPVSVSGTGTARTSSKDTSRVTQKAPQGFPKPLFETRPTTANNAVDMFSSGCIPLSSLKTLRNQLAEVHPSQRPKFKNKLKSNLRKNYSSRFMTSPSDKRKQHQRSNHKENAAGCAQQLVNCNLGTGFDAGSHTAMNQFQNQSSNINFNFKIPNLTTTQPTTNTYNSNNLRYIVIDGSNVAREHGNQLGRVFSSKGIKIVVDYFLKRGHTEVKAFIPRFRRGCSDKKCPTTEPELIDEMEKNNNLVYTPSRYVDDKLIVPYDDRFILKSAEHYNAIIVSNDNYRDLMSESSEWRRLVQNNLLQYSFVGDLFLIADDPMGRSGPTLDQMLFNNPKNNETKCRNNQFNINNNRSNTFEHNQDQSWPTSGADSQQPRTSGFSSNSHMRDRSHEETSVLYKKLSDVFPLKNDAIRKLLKEHPYAFDIRFFSNKLTNNNT